MGRSLWNAAECRCRQISGNFTREDESHGSRPVRDGERDEDPLLTYTTHLLTL